MQCSSLKPGSKAKGKGGLGSRKRPQTPITGKEEIGLEKAEVWVEVGLGSEGGNRLEVVVQSTWAGFSGSG